jgi:hypothetical protein
LSFYVEISFCVAIFSLIPIGFIPEDRISYVGHMDADLMSATRFDPTLEKRILIANIRFYDRIVSDSLLTITIDSDFCLISCIFHSKELCSYGSFFFFRGSDDDCMIDFLYFPSLKQLEKCFECFLFFCDHDTSARITIDAMYE